MLMNALIFLLSLAAMELIAYLTHKYLMHGPLWFLHESHHVHHEGWFEKNDLFGVFFAIPSIVLIYFGTHGYPPLLWVGLGMAAYGFIYFAFHDVVVHRRLDLRLKPKSSYMKRIIQAHHMHHKTRVKEGAVSFGFLYAPPVEKLREQEKQPT
jgi:beta-carotene 3-hydroxylase